MKKLTALFICLSFIKTWAQQDPQYNLYQFNQMIINPAFAGSRDALAILGSHRQQWVGFKGAPQTTCISAHSPITKKNIGVGFTALNDVMGPRNVISFYGNFAYILKITEKAKLSFGLNAGYNRYQFNFDKITFNNVNEVVPSDFLQNQNRGALDLNGGLYFKTPGFFCGFSATHLNKAKVYSYESTQASGTISKYNYKLGTHLFFTIGKSFIVNKNLVFAPTIMTKMVGNKTGVDLNLNFFIAKKLWLGAFYRNGYGPGGLFQYYITDQFRVAYSYDTGLGSASKLGSSHEVMLGFDFSGPKQRMVNPRFL